MGIESVPGAIPGSTYRGFSGPPHKISDGEKRRRTVTLAGVGAALLLGLGSGLLAKPAIPPVGQQEMEPVRQTSGPELSIVVDHPPAPPAQPIKNEPLEVLPAELAKAAPRPPPQPVSRRVPRQEAFDEPAPIDCDAPGSFEEARACRSVDVAADDQARWEDHGRWEDRRPWEEPRESDDWAQ